MAHFEYKGPPPPFEYKGRFIKNWFSNMEPMDNPIIIDGVSFDTVEKAYQAMKATDPDTRRTIAGMNSYEAKRYWRGRRPRPGWENIKLGVMEKLLEYKFAPGTSWHKQLMATGDQPIVEYNNWNDRFWGAHVQIITADTVHIQGENHLGGILMKIRDRRRNKRVTERDSEIPKVFIGGSRSMRELPPSVTARIDKIINSKFTVLIGDAPGADTLVQKYLAEKGYPNAIVFCTGTCRNNAGGWETKVSQAKAGEKGFDFHKIKDGEMARDANYGLMLWDGKSKGTLNNILNLLDNGKKSLVFFSPGQSLHTIGKAGDLAALLSECYDKDLALFERKLGLQQRLENLRAMRESAPANSRSDSTTDSPFRNSAHDTQPTGRSR